MKKELTHLRRLLDVARGTIKRRRDLLTAVLDAGRPHSRLCECDYCLAWDAVRKELHGE